MRRDDACDILLDLYIAGMDAADRNADREEPDTLSPKFWATKCVEELDETITARRFEGEGRTWSEAGDLMWSLACFVAHKNFVGGKPEEEREARRGLVGDSLGTGILAGKRSVGRLGRLRLLLRNILLKGASGG